MQECKAEEKLCRESFTLWRLSVHLVIDAIICGAGGGRFRPGDSMEAMAENCVEAICVRKKLRGAEGGGVAIKIVAERPIKTMIGGGRHRENTRR